MKFRDSDRAFSMSMHKPLYSCFPFVSFTITKGSHCTGKIYLLDKEGDLILRKEAQQTGERGGRECVGEKGVGWGGSRKRDVQIGLVMERGGEMGRKRDGRGELVSKWILMSCQPHRVTSGQGEWGRERRGGKRKINEKENWRAAERERERGEKGKQKMRDR